MCLEKLLVVDSYCALCTVHCSQFTYNQPLRHVQNFLKYGTLSYEMNHLLYEAFFDCFFEKKESLGYKGRSGGLWLFLILVFFDSNL